MLLVPGPQGPPKPGDCGRREHLPDAASVFLLANVWLVVNWLEDKGVIGAARHVRKGYLTGTAITIIIVLLILLAKPAGQAVGRIGLGRGCPVCDHRGS